MFSIDLTIPNYLNNFFETKYHSETFFTGQFSLLILSWKLNTLTKGLITHTDIPSKKLHKSKTFMFDHLDLKQSFKSNPLFSKNNETFLLTL